jgi:hypothetical protein
MWLMTMLQNVHRPNNGQACMSLRCPTESDVKWDFDDDAR